MGVGGGVPCFSLLQAPGNAAKGPAGVSASPTSHLSPSETEGTNPRAWPVFGKEHPKGAQCLGAHSPIWEHPMFGATQWAGSIGRKKKQRIKEGTKGKDKEST